MFGSTILDVAAGIIFGFLAISLFTSASVEAINSALNVRVNNLQTGIMALVNDPNFTGLAKELYQHALISPLGPWRRRSDQERSRLYRQGPVRRGHARHHRPLRRNAGRRRPGAGVEATAALKARMASSTSRSQNYRPADQSVASGDGRSQRRRHGSAKKDLANWFDNGMDRLSGDFKRRTQVMTFVIALVTAFVVNLDTIRVGTALWGEPALSDRLKHATVPSRRARNRR